MADNTSATLLSGDYIFLRAKMSVWICNRRTLTRRRRCGSWTSWTVGQVGQVYILNSNYYNSLIINDSNNLEEKTSGWPSWPSWPSWPTPRQNYRR